MKKNGFTLIEILITIVIIGILIAILVPYLNNAKKSAQISATISTLRSICSAEEIYYIKSKYERYASLRKLARKRLLDSRFLKRRVVINGYRFRSKVRKKNLKLSQDL